MFDVVGPIAATGRTDDGYGYDRLLLVTDVQPTAAGCNMQLYVEYVGPHEAVEYITRATLASGRLHGTGTFRYNADDCQKPDPAECSYECALTLEGEVRV